MDNFEVHIDNNVINEERNRQELERYLDEQEQDRIQDRVNYMLRTLDENLHFTRRFNNNKLSIDNRYNEFVDMLKDFVADNHDYVIDQVDYLFHLFTLMISSIEKDENYKRSY